MTEEERDKLKRKPREKMPTHNVTFPQGLHMTTSDTTQGLPVKELQGEKAARVGPHWYSYDPHDTFTDRVPSTRTTRSAAAFAEASATSSTSTASSSSSLQQQSRPSRLPRECQGLKKLHVFLWESLHNSDFNPRFIEWVDEPEGIFRIRHPESLAELWGTAKGNPNMTSDKMSRAIRYCYTNNTLIKVTGNQRTYKFGPSALIRK